MDDDVGDHVTMTKCKEYNVLTEHYTRATTWGHNAFLVGGIVSHIVCHKTVGVGEAEQEIGKARNGEI